jgi:hypothetical protein
MAGNSERKALDDLRDGRLDHVLIFDSLVAASSTEAVYRARARTLTASSALQIHRLCPSCSSSWRSSATRCSHNVSVAVKICTRAVQMNSKANSCQNPFPEYASRPSSQHCSTSLPQSPASPETSTSSMVKGTRGNSRTIDEDIEKKSIALAENEAKALYHAEGKGAPVLLWFGNLGRNSSSERTVAVMEFLQGEDIEWRYRRSTGNERNAKLAVRAALACLQQLHSKGVAHCAIHPSNLVPQQNDVLLSSKLVDFRRAQICNATCTVSEWNVHARRDLFAVGALAHQLLVEPENRLSESMLATRQPLHVSNVAEEFSSHSPLRRTSLTTKNGENACDQQEDLEQSPGAMLSMVDEVNLSLTGKRFIAKTLSGTNGFDSAEFALGDAWVAAVDGAIHLSNRMRKRSKQLPFWRSGMRVLPAGRMINGCTRKSNSLDISIDDSDPM